MITLPRSLVLFKSEVWVLALIVLGGGGVKHTV